MGKTEDNLKEILEIYRKKFNDKELFSHLIERIELHIGKLRKLKEAKSKAELFQREVADMYLLIQVLLQLEKVSGSIIEKSSDYYLKKIRELFEV
jgi:hypothetical protein